MLFINNPSLGGILLHVEGHSCYSSPILIIENYFVFIIMSDTASILAYIHSRPPPPPTHTAVNENVWAFHFFCEWNCKIEKKKQEVTTQRAAEETAENLENERTECPASEWWACALENAVSLQKARGCKFLHLSSRLHRPRKRNNRERCIAQYSQFSSFFFWYKSWENSPKKIISRARGRNEEEES